jgi:hypothetical protein
MSIMKREKKKKQQNKTHWITVLVVDREAQSYVQNTALRYAQKPSYTKKLYIHTHTGRRERKRRDCAHYCTDEKNCSRRGKEKECVSYVSFLFLFHSFSKNNNNKVEERKKLAFQALTEIYGGNFDCDEAFE